jgi:hypothetical protein
MTFVILFVGALVGAVLRAITSRSQPWKSRETAIDTVVSAVPAMAAPAALASLPVPWVQTMATKLDQPAEQALLALFVSYVLSHVVASRLRTQLPEWIAKKLDERTMGPPGGRP